MYNLSETSYTFKNSVDMSYIWNTIKCHKGPLHPMCFGCNSPPVYF